MNAYIKFLGSCGEIGASSCYLYIEGTGIIIDSGLHPKKRDNEAFPDYSKLIGKQVDLLILTHAHTDHIGGIPYLLKHHPYIQIFSTNATADLCKIMLKDTAKLLKSEVSEEFADEMLDLYKPEILERIWMLIKDFEYNQEIEFTGRNGRVPITITFFHSGHILGSAGILIKFGNKTFFHTGDINMSNQAILAKAELPAHFINHLVMETTNGAAIDLPDYSFEQKRLAKYINDVINENGSILFPVFALGKTQELLTILFRLMKKGSIPAVPIYSSGLGSSISKIYDNYCYKVPFTKPGFEISDIPQLPIYKNELLSGKYFKEPSCVLTTSGMMNTGTYSYNLALKWMQLRNFGIAITGYQDEETPGYALLKSQREKEFLFGSVKMARKCSVSQFRFTSHSSRQGLSDIIRSLTPLNLYLVHGDDEALKSTALELIKFHQNPIFIPSQNKEYILD